MSQQIKYYAQWDRLARDSLNSVLSDQHEIHKNTWALIVAQHIRKVVLDPRRFQVDSVSEFRGCSQCAYTLADINKRLTERHQKIPKFTDLL